MAANFWLSTHYKYWLLTKEELVTSAGRQEDLKYLTAEEYQKVHILFANFIQALGEHLKHRQQVIAAGTHYFKRFYSKNSLKNIDPLLLAPTCLYLASKVEENGVISNTRLIQTCATVVKNKFMAVFNYEYPYRINQVYFFRDIIQRGVQCRNKCIGGRLVQARQGGNRYVCLSCWFYGDKWRLFYEPQQKLELFRFCFRGCCLSFFSHILWSVVSF